MKKLGIIICDRWRRCAGGKCLRALKQREGAFSRYRDEEIELVGYTTCDGCPGGNVEYAPAEMKKNPGGLPALSLHRGLSQVHRNQVRDGGGARNPPDPAELLRDPSGSRDVEWVRVAEQAPGNPH